MIVRFLVELARFVRSRLVHSRVKPLRWKSPTFYDEFPRPLDRFLLKIIAETPVAEHLEKCVVVGVEADVFEIVVFAAGANALLGVGHARRIPRRLLLAQKNRDELVHAGVGEKKIGRVRQKRRRRDNRVLLLAEEIEKRLPDLGRGHDVEIKRDIPRVRELLQPGADEWAKRSQCDRLAASENAAGMKVRVAVIQLIGISDGVRLADNIGGKPFHFFKLRTALQEKQIDAYFLEFSNPRCDLIGGADEAGT